jgi:hypothetical protein
MRKIRSRFFVSSGVRARHVQPHLTGWLLHGDIFFRGPWSDWWWRGHTWGTAVLVGCIFWNKSSWESTVAFPNSFSNKFTASSPGRLQIPMQLSHQLQDHHQLDRGLQHNMQLARANVRVAKLFWSVYPHLLIWCPWQISWESWLLQIWSC